MLNTGTKELDKILGVGQSPSVCRGLRYTGFEVKKEPGYYRNIEFSCLRTS